MIPTPSLKGTSMKPVNILKNLAISTVLTAALLASNSIVLAADLKAKSVVLVHGAFADGSSWNKVTPLLKEAGLDVIAVQNPLNSLEGDVAFTKRAIQRADGPVVLVGHSWGGMVITEAGDGDKVKSLVYVAAYAPDIGQSLGEAAQLEAHPAPGLAALKEDKDGYLYLTDDAAANYFAQDLSKEEAALIAANQGLLNSKALGEKVTKAAWKSKPTFYAIAGNDNMTPTKLQREFAKKLGATTKETPSSHVIMISNPEVVADLIIEAAK